MTPALQGVVVPFPGRVTFGHRRPERGGDALPRSVTPASAALRGALPRAFTGLEEGVGLRLAAWSQGRDLPPVRPLSGRTPSQREGPPTSPPSTTDLRPATERPAGDGGTGRGPRTGASRRPSTDGPGASGPLGDPASVPPQEGESRHLARLVHLMEQAVADLAGVERRLAELSASEATIPAQPAVQWLEDEELAGRLQSILGRQARQRGIDLS